MVVSRNNSERLWKGPWVHSIGSERSTFHRPPLEMAHPPAHPHGGANASESRGASRFGPRMESRTLPTRLTSGAVSNDSNKSPSSIPCAFLYALKAPPDCDFTSSWPLPTAISAFADPHSGDIVDPPPSLPECKQPSKTTARFDNTRFPLSLAGYNDFFKSHIHRLNPTRLLGTSCLRGSRVHASQM